MGMASKQYRKLWKRFDDLYGADGKASPLLHLETRRERRENDITPLAHVNPVNGVPTVNLAPTHKRTLRRMAKGRAPRSVRNAPKWARGNMRSEWVEKKKDMMSTLMHEWAHVFQDRDEIGRLTNRADHGPIPDITEGAAHLFTKQAARDRLKGHKPGGSMYKLQAKRLEDTLDDDFWMRAQFGENYGMNPRKIGLEDSVEVAKQLLAKRVYSRET